MSSPLYLGSNGGGWFPATAKALHPFMPKVWAMASKVQSSGEFWHHGSVPWWLGGQLVVILFENKRPNWDDFCCQENFEQKKHVVSMCLCLFLKKI